MGDLDGKGGDAGAPGMPLSSAPMDERVARIRTSREALIFAENAGRRGEAVLQTQAIEHARILKANEEGFISPAEQAIAQALYAYEAEQARRKGRSSPAYRTRKMMREHGPLGAAERMVLAPKKSTGFSVLEEIGRKDLSFEAIINRYPDEFSTQAVAAARARLAGEPVPAVRRATVPTAVAPSPVFDAEARHFLEGFQRADNWFLIDWLPRYRGVVAVVKAAVGRNSPETLFELVWKTRNNHVSNAGQGVLGFEVVERLRDQLLSTLRDIVADSSPGSYSATIRRFEQWRARGDLGSVPRLLIARAFATIHSDRYHTTVDAPKQERVIPWFVEHTGFLAPEGDWATQADALTAHLDRCDVFAGDRELRNLFPWFVYEQLRDARGRLPFQPGHTPKPATGEVVFSMDPRTREYRHNVLQDRLHALLVERHGADAVGTERPTGTGGRADALVQRSDGRFDLYEIKPAISAADAVRQAVGQLLEYAYRKGGLEPASLHIVSDAPLDEVTAGFLGRLAVEFALRFEYLHIPLNEPVAQRPDRISL